MKSHSGNQKIKQLEKRKGGYFYLKLDHNIVNKFERKRSTRVICTIDDVITYRCGLNHLGDGNFFIIVAGKHLEKLNKQLGDIVSYRIDVDPDQLGVEIPEVLTVLLEQDSDAKAIFERLTDGKKRSLIYQIIKIKNIDKQVQNTLDFLAKEDKKKQ